MESLESSNHYETLNLVLGQLLSAGLVVVGGESSLGAEQRPALRDPAGDVRPGHGGHLAVQQAVNAVVDSNGIVAGYQTVPGE